MRNKICLSIGHTTYEETVELLKQLAIAEVRIDLLSLTDDQLKSIFTQHKNLIATHRVSDGNFQEMVDSLNNALEWGCAYIDIDIEVPMEWRDIITSKAKQLGRKVILSYHNYNQTPSTGVLEQLISEMRNAGANIVKIACMANSKADCASVLGLYKNHSNIVAFCMGELGRITRIAAPCLGAPFTYVSIEGKETAPGQIGYEEMVRVLGELMVDG
jgi:3-dehydroquinate dehydratase type I